MVRMHTTLDTDDPERAVGHAVRSLKETGFGELEVSVSDEGFTVRGIRGNTPLFAFGSMLPYDGFGLFTRVAAELTGRGSTSDQGPAVDVDLEVFAIRPSDARKDGYWMLRNPEEILPDTGQVLRVQGMVLQKLGQPVESASPYDPAMLEPEPKATGDRPTLGIRILQTVLFLLVASLVIFLLVTFHEYLPSP